MHDVIAALNPVLRGWGQYFQTGSAADHFTDVDDYVVKRLKSLRVERNGRNLRAGQADRWDREYFESLGLHRLRGTIRYPGKPNSWQREPA
jgi:RNA-directed DNA polymerase